MSSTSSGFLKRMELAQAKKNSAARMTNVVCSTAIFPDEFDVDANRVPNRKGAAGDMSTFQGSAAAAAAAAASASNLRRDSGAEDCDDSVSDVFANSNAIIPLSHVENQIVALQVQYNVEIMKHKLFSLLDMNILPVEEDASLQQVDALQSQLTMLLCPQSTAPPALQPSSSPQEGSSYGSRPVTPSRGGRPSSATRRTPVTTPSNAAGHSHPSSPFLAAVQQPSKLLQQTQQAIDTYFKFAFEEVALRRQSLQNRPFSLRAFHQVAREQVKLREQALHDLGVTKHIATSKTIELEDVKERVTRHDAEHAATLQVLLTENRVLRQKIMDLQLRLKIDEPIPVLHAASANRHGDSSSGEALAGAAADGSTSAPVDPNEKHYEMLNRRLTEECALLTHSLEQSNNVVRSLHMELQTSKMSHASLKDEFKKYVQEQDQLDAEMRRTFAQNEATTEQARKECALAAKRCTEVEHQYKELNASVSGLHGKIAALSSEKDDALAERDHLRKLNESLVSEAENAKEALASVEAQAEEDAKIAAEKLQIAQARIAELENDGTREKLEVALRDIAALQDKVKTLQRAVESRDKMIATLKQEHKAEVNKLEEKITFQAEQLLETTAKFEELLVRERQKGVELAEKKVSEARAVFEEEKGTLLAKIADAERLQEDLVHELMLFHRQSSVMEPFLKAHLTTDQVRALAKLCLKRDLATVGGPSAESDGAQSTGGATGAGGDDGGVLHTPRTRLYFGQHHLFLPEDVQSRLTLASEALESARTEAHNMGDRRDDDDENPRIPQHATKTALLLKSKLTTEFLLQLHERRQYNDLPVETFLSEDDRSHHGGACGTPSPTTTTANDEYLECVDTSRRVPKRVLNAQQQMFFDDMKSRLVEAKLRVKALEDEIHSINSGDKLVSAGMQTSFATPGSAGLKPRSAGRSRPSSSHSQRSNRSGDSPLLSSSATNDTQQQQQQQPATLLSHRTSLRGSAALLAQESRALAIIEDDSASEIDAGSASGVLPYRHRGLSAASGAPRPGSAGQTSTTDGAMQRVQRALGSSGNINVSEELAGLRPRLVDETRDAEDEIHNLDVGAKLLREFPGLHHAAEFFDLFESFKALRDQLSELVFVCSREAERGVLHPDDLETMQELLHAKFTVFRSVEAQNHLMLNRLHRKKEDLMRRREEELEKVLTAMQNISITHPKEAQQLLRVAKSASRQRQGGHRHSTSASFRAYSVGLHNDTSWSPTDQHHISNGELSAVVVRPLSQQSMRRPTPAPSDVLVSGAPALMSLRNKNRASSATPKIGIKQP